MDNVDFEGLSGRVKNLLARTSITHEMLPTLSIVDLKSIHGLGEKGLWDEVIPTILSAGITLRHVHEPREELLRKLYPNPRNIPASVMIFEGVLSSVQVFCIKTPKTRRVPVYGDIAKLSERRITELYGRTRCEWIASELAKYGLGFRRYFVAR